MQRGFWARGPVSCDGIRLDPSRPRVTDPFQPKRGGGGRRGWGPRARRREGRARRRRPLGLIGRAFGIISEKTKATGGNRKRNYAHREMCQAGCELPLLCKSPQ